MSDFDTYELSSRQSAPIHLYKFTRNSDEWFYCSGTQEDFIFDGDTYTPAVINHSRIGTTQNPYDDTLHIECNTGLEIITDNIGEFQRDKIYLTLIRIQNYNASYYENIWFGYISNMIYNNKTSEINLNSLFASLNKRVVRELFSYQCRHILYGDYCGLLESSNENTGTITGITSGTTIFANEFSTGTADEFLGSLIVTSDGEKRVAIEHAGGTSVKILRPFSDATVGTTFYITNKCDRTLGGSCTDLSNTDNFGGFPYMKKNPYKQILDRSGVEIT